MSGYLLNVIQCRNTRKMMKAALDGGWEWIGYTKSGHVEIRWPETGALLHCATTPSDQNAWKQFARGVHRISGLELYAKGNHRRSRKSMKVADPQVEASRRRYAAEVAAREAAEEATRLAETRRRIAAERSAEDDRRRRSIEDLMRR